MSAPESPNLMAKKRYRYCIVPMCSSTTIKTPSKIFLPVPRNPKIRRQWCSIMKRDEKHDKKNRTLSPSTSLHCCEDHFNIEEDTANLIKYKVLGNITLVLKKGVVPHIFDCQKPNKINGIIKTRELEVASSLYGTNKNENVEDEAQPNTTQRKSAAHDDVPKKRRKIGKTLAQTAVASTSRLQDPLAMEDGLEQNRIMDEENAFEDDIQHSDNSISLSRIDFVDVKREDIDVIDIKEEPIRFDESTDIDLPAYISQGELHIKEEKKDQCEQFGEFVSVSLEQLPEDQATLAQNDIENVLMKFKMLAANTLTH